MMINNFPVMNLFAHRKGGGSAANGRNSVSCRLGAKRTDGQAVDADSIIYCQRDTKIHLGKNIGIGDDGTLLVLIDDVVRFERPGKTRKQVPVCLVEEAK